MSMALLAGFVVAYPINWWLVTRGLKHGLLTVRDQPPAREVDDPSHGTHQPVDVSPNEEPADQVTASRGEIVWMTVFSIAVFALGGHAVAIIHGNMCRRVQVGKGSRLLVGLVEGVAQRGFLRRVEVCADDPAALFAQTFDHLVRGVLAHHHEQCGLSASASTSVS